MTCLKTKLFRYKMFAVVRYLQKRLYISRSNTLEKQGKIGVGLYLLI